jgi:hypothetical protein
VLDWPVPGLLPGLPVREIVGRSHPFSLKSVGAMIGMKSALRQPASPPHEAKANETSVEQRERRRLRCSDFGDHDLAVADLEIGKEDLVDARIERAAAGTGSGSVIRIVATAAPAVAATIARAEGVAATAASTHSLP